MCQVNCQTFFAATTWHLPGLITVCGGMYVMTRHSSSLLHAISKEFFARSLRSICLSLVVPPGASINRGSRIRSIPATETGPANERAENYCKEGVRKPSWQRPTSNQRRRQHCHDLFSILYLKFFSCWCLLASVSDCKSYVDICPLISMLPWHIKPCTYTMFDRRVADRSMCS
jgi:hypothetical protein